MNKTYFLFLNIILNIRQTIENTIPRDAHVYVIVTSAVTISVLSSIGEPSGGGPTI